MASVTGWHYAYPKMFPCTFLSCLWRHEPSFYLSEREGDNAMWEGVRASLCLYVPNGKATFDSAKSYNKLATHVVPG